MNHIKYRKRTFKDDLNSILNDKADTSKSGNTIILPELPNPPIVFWERDDSNVDESKKNRPGRVDDVVKKCITWPMRTDSLCHHCCHKFDTIPVPIPETYDALRKIYICRGFFCSWQCAKAYNMYYMPGPRSGDRSAFISLLAHKMWVKYLKKDSDKNHGEGLLRYCMHSITPAKNRCELKSFGGKLSIEEYRKGFFNIVPPEEAITGKPFLSIRQRLALPFVDGASKSDIKINSAIENTGIKNDNIRSMRKTQRMESSVDHEDSNKFCDMLNRAKTDRNVMKRKNKEVDKNNLLSSMGVTVSKRSRGC